MGSWHPLSYHPVYPLHNHQENQVTSFRHVASDAEGWVSCSLGSIQNPLRRPQKCSPECATSSEGSIVSLFFLKMSRTLCIYSDEFLGIDFLCCVSVKLLPVRCAGIDACLVRIFDNFLVIGAGAGAMFLWVGGGAAAAVCWTSETRELIVSWLRVAIVVDVGLIYVLSWMLKYADSLSIRKEDHDIQKTCWLLF